MYAVLLDTAVCCRLGRLRALAAVSKPSLALSRPSPARRAKKVLLAPHRSACLFGMLSPARKLQPILTCELLTYNCCVPDFTWVQGKELQSLPVHGQRLAMIEEESSSPDDSQPQLDEARQAPKL